MGRSEIRLGAGVLLMATLVATSAAAYLPSAAEVRRFWDDQRRIEGTLYLSYRAPSGVTEPFEVLIRPDGLWAKRVAGTNGKRRVIWKWAERLWVQEADGRLRAGRRTHPNWDDWVFEPRVDALLDMTPRQAFATRGLGRHDDQYLWLFGARHTKAKGWWFGLLRDPIRLGLWRSSNPRIGRVRLEYDRGHKYPDRIRFSRRNMPDYVLEKRDVRWNPDPVALGFRIPRPVSAYSPPPRVEAQESITETTNPNRRGAAR